MAGIVLAGGQSRRMGQDKALVGFLGEPLLQRIVQRVQQACPPVLVVAPEERRTALESLGLRVVADRFPHGGPLAGLHAGLLAAGDGYHFVISCDQPFVEPALVRHLLRRAEPSPPRRGAAASLASAPASPQRRPASFAEPSGSTAGPDAVVPRVGGKLQVLHAVYHGRVAEVAQRSLRSGERAIRSILERLRWLEVPEAELAVFGDPGRLFFNVNTPQALDVALRLAGKESPAPSPGPEG